MSWYVLYTAAKAEKQVRQRLANVGIETFLPLHKTKRKWSDRVKVIEEPLFRSYIFVRCPEHKLRELLNVYGVARIVYYLRKPAVVRDNEIEAIREFLQMAENKELITSGDEVEIICGLLENKSGKVLSVNDKAVMLYLEELGAKVCVRREEVNKVQKN